MKHLFNPYRPELHYMRGPGPKWQEKHASDSTSFGGRIKVFDAARASATMKANLQGQADGI
jgi:hypothetical protein